ncbi:MAG: hypothetical protein PWQ28_326 [Candidatus Woesearchaeota archaeon]|nr:hypothetical protein [Candidatus Woesearchaeota archaeon]
MYLKFMILKSKISKSFNIEYFFAKMVNLKMDFDEYQKEALKTDLKTSINGNYLIYPVLGLADETGEVVGKFKKLYRDRAGVIDEEYKTEILKELGDVLWYMTVICDRLGVKLSDVAEKNIEKLSSRKMRNAIHGNGDNR